MRKSIKNGKYNFNYGWTFRLADAFPLAQALEATSDAAGTYFYERAYKEESRELGPWKEVSLPHSFNDEDIFKNRILDAGSSQKRTFACYRKWFSLGDMSDMADKKVFLEIEGIRQTCYLYVNGRLAGYYEAGSFPIGFDITEFITDDEEQLIAIATDNTATRNIDFISAETPNHPDAVPGSFVAPQSNDLKMPEGTIAGVGYFWNCNDFNPTVGGLSRNIYIHVKPKTYLTLPLYSNLKTKGVYVYASDYDIIGRRVKLNIEAEVRNEKAVSCSANLLVEVFDAEGNSVKSFMGNEAALEAGETCRAFRSIIPENAYRKTEKVYERGESLEPGESFDSGKNFEPVSEEEAGEVETASYKVELLKATADMEEVTFWDIDNPYLYKVRVSLMCDGKVVDTQEIETGFRSLSYSEQGLKVNGAKVWLTGYAQRATNEWVALATAPDWLHDMDAKLIRESNANHIRFMHVAGSPADIRSFNRFGVVCTQPCGDKERESFGRQWKQRVELMRDIIIYFRNDPCIFFWEVGNNSVNKEHMREMRLLKEKLDVKGNRFIGCRTINTQEVIAEAEYAGTMLNRHAAPFIAKQVPITETEYHREESPRRVWDDFTPPYFDYDNNWVGRGGRKEAGYDTYDLTAEDFALSAAGGYQEFFNDRIGGASGNNLYSAAAALCWTDSCQHGRQSYSENARMSGRVDPARVKKQNFRVFQVMQNPKPDIMIVGHWNYPPIGDDNYRYPLKEFDGRSFVKTGEYAYRNPKDKTVYIIGSYDIARVELFVNGEFAGKCDKPERTFIFPVEHVDVTRSGIISAIAYDYDDNTVAEDRIETAGAPARLKLTAFTGEKGFLADGSDVAYIDIEVLDENGRICPLCDSRIDFSVEGPAEFLGGYNSGRFKGPDKDDNVIHKPYIFAECGINRVFLRSKKKNGEKSGEKNAEKNGEITVTAVMRGENDELLTSKIRLVSVNTAVDALTEQLPQHLSAKVSPGAFARSDAFPANKRADAVKYVKREGVYCKVLVNGQEPNTNGTLSKVDNGAIYSPVLFILERMHSSRPEVFSFSFDGKILTIDSGTNHVTAEVGRTHLIVNGEENLLNGQPYINEDGYLILEINAIIGYISGVKAYYDEISNLFRIEW